MFLWYVDHFVLRAIKTRLTQAKFLSTKLLTFKKLFNCLKEIRVGLCREESWYLR